MSTCRAFGTYGWDLAAARGSSHRARKRFSLELAGESQRSPPLPNAFSPPRQGLGAGSPPGRVVHGSTEQVRALS